MSFQIDIFWTQVNCLPLENGRRERAEDEDMQRQRVIVIGAGVGGLVAALLLAAREVDVTLIERAEAPGGKIRRVEAGGAFLDAGPTVFTMRWAFDQIFEEAGATLSDHLRLHRAQTLARHIWRGGEHLDLFADVERSVDAISAFAGSVEAEGFRRFCARARSIYEALRDSFILAERPSPIDLVRHAGIGGLPGLLRISPFATAAAAALRALCDLLRLVSLSCARHADAGGACGTGGRVDGEGRHA